jgi:CRP/FNR family transcriptional regulator
LPAHIKAGRNIEFYHIHAMDSSEIVKQHFRNTFEPALLEEISVCPFFQMKEGDEIRHQTQSQVRYTPLVIDGSIRVTRIDDSGKEVLMYFIKPKESCFLSITASLNNNFSTIDSLRAVIDEPTRFVALNDEQIRKWNNQYKTWRDYVANIYNKRFIDFFSIIDNVVFKRVDEKMIHAINQLKDENNEVAVTHQELAVRIGSAREVISRLLKELEKDGKIALSRKKIKILQPL